MKNLGRRMRQWLTSIFSRRQSTKIVKAKPRPTKIKHEWAEVELSKAYNWMTGRHLYATDVGYLDGDIHDWHWTPEGQLARRMTGHFWIKSKTRRWQQSMFSQVVIERKDIPIDHRQLVSLMEDKTYNLENSFVDLLERSVGKNKRFPFKRGRFTVLSIHNVNDGDN